MLNARLQELEGEKEELALYKAADRDHRAVEYCMTEMERIETLRRLSELEAYRDGDAENARDIHSKAVEAQEKYVVKTSNWRDLWLIGFGKG